MREPIPPGHPGERPRRPAQSEPGVTPPAFPPLPPPEAASSTSRPALVAGSIIALLVAVAVGVLLWDPGKMFAPKPGTETAATNPHPPSEPGLASLPSAPASTSRGAGDDVPLPPSKKAGDPDRILGHIIQPDSPPTSPPAASPPAAPPFVGPPAPPPEKSRPHKPRKPQLAPDDLFVPDRPPPTAKPPSPPPPRPVPEKPVTPPRPAPPPVVKEKSPAEREAEAQKKRRELADAAFQKRLARSEADLREELAKVPELRLVPDLELKAFREEQALAARKGLRVTNLAHFYNLRLHQALIKRAFKEGVQLRGGVGSRLDPRVALLVQTVSKELRDMGFVSVPGVASRVALRGGRRGRFANVTGTSTAGGTDKAKIEAFKNWCDANSVEKFTGALATLLQMLQVEDVPTRLVLVRELGKATSAASGEVLARRALFDPSRQVRQAAIDALKKRPAAQYQAILLGGFQYPWVPVADHAAQALVQLEAKGAVPQLVDLLDQPDSTLPMRDKRTGKQVVRELVRLNHMRNCFLCHLPSADTKDGLVRGAVPTPGKPLPPAYYAASSGDFARADTTFLRQDFSLNLVVEDAAPWPAEQRFDYVVRQRILPPEKGVAEKKPDPPSKGVTTEPREPPSKGITTYPQREAALYALRHLTGKDAGDSSQQWREQLSIPRKEDKGKKTATPKGADAKPGTGSAKETTRERP